MTDIRLGSLTIGNRQSFTLIAGPCQIESRAHAREMAAGLSEICTALGIGWIYKSSFDKANRTSLKAERGIGLAEGLDILAGIREEFGCPVLTDVHSAEQCKPAAEAVDVLQIPAFLCRQTDLLLAAGETGRAINVKKGQFLAPWDMANVAAKIASTGNEQIMLCDRGTSFGYNTLVSDMRGLPIMAATGYPVSSTLPIRCSSPAVSVALQADSANSSPPSRALPSPSVLRLSLSRRMRTRIARPAMGRIWCL